MRRVCVLAVLAVLVGLGCRPATAGGDSIRCGGDLVQTGDPAIVVQHACGRPDFVDPWIGGVGQAYGRALSMQEWTYNRGPARLLRILVFRNGRLIRIRNGDYGFRPNSRPSGCHPRDITPGMSKYRLLHLCGEPAQQSGRFIFSALRRSAGRTFYLRRGRVPVYRERWIYNFGARRLLREVTLENAVVVATDTLQRGFND